MTEKFSFVAIMALLTTRNLGDCSYLDALRLTEFLLRIERPPYKRSVLDLFKEAQAILSQQFPQFADIDMQLEIKTLTAEINTAWDKSAITVCDDWILKQSIRLGLSLDEPIEVSQPDT